MVHFSEVTWLLMGVIAVAALFGGLLVQAAHAQHERQVYELRRRVLELHKAHAQRMAEIAAREREEEELARVETIQKLAA